MQLHRVHRSVGWVVVVCSLSACADPAGDAGRVRATDAGAPDGGSTPAADGTVAADAGGAPAEGGAPPGTGYTSAASVDLSRAPDPPRTSSVIDLTAPITVSDTVTDVTYNVTAAIAGAAVNLTPTGRLERVVVRVNDLADNGVAGPGTVRDVAVYDANAVGFYAVAHFEGAVVASHNAIDFRLEGTGVTLAPDAMLKSEDADHFGFYVWHLYDSHLDGAMVAIGAGTTSRDASATGFELWSDGQRNSFNIIISNANAGYGLAIYGGSAFNTIRELYADGAGGFDSDPGLSIGGGAHDNVIERATIKRYVLGLIFGEDVDPPPYSNRVETLLVESTPYPGVIMDRGAYDNVVGAVGGATLTSTGSPSPYQGSVFISNRPGQTNAPPHGNQVLGLVQAGTEYVPRYAVYLGPGTTGNVVRGAASSWSEAKELDEGSGNEVSVP